MHELTVAVGWVAGAIIFHALLGGHSFPSLTSIETALRDICQRLTDIRYRLPKEPNK
jgi:hypothetical protein